MSDELNHQRKPTNAFCEAPLHDTNALATRYKLSPRTIREWITRGCPTPNGVVRLPAMRIGTSWMVREEDCLLFENRTRPWK